MMTEKEKKVNRLKAIFFHFKDVASSSSVKYYQMKTLIQIHKEVKYFVAI